MKLKNFLQLTTIITSFSISAMDLKPGIEAYESGDYETAKKMLLQHANGGNLIAQEYITALKNKKKIEFKDGEIQFNPFDKTDLDLGHRTHLEWPEASDIFVKWGAKKPKRAVSLLEGLRSQNNRACLLLSRLPVAKEKRIEHAKNAFSELGDLEAVFELQKLGYEDEDVGNVLGYITKTAKDYPDSQKLQGLYKHFIKKATDLEGSIKDKLSLLVEVERQPKKLFQALMTGDLTREEISKYDRYKHNRHLALQFARTGALYGNATLIQILLESPYTAIPEKEFLVRVNAHLNNPQALSSIAFSLEHGKNGYEKNHKKAFELYQKAAEHPKAEPMFWWNLAICYENGIGTPIDVDQALFWFNKYFEATKEEKKEHILKLENLQKARNLRKDAEAGDPVAVITYAEALLETHYTPEDASTAWKMLSKLDRKLYTNKTITLLIAFLWNYEDLLDKADAIAIIEALLTCEPTAKIEKVAKNLLNLAFKYAMLENKPQKGLPFIEKAMSLNYGMAFFIRGKVYEQQKAWKEMFECFQKAEELGDTFVFNDLGFCYERGFGTEQDDVKAVEYYRKAQKAGNQFEDPKNFGVTLYNLAMMMHQNRGGLVFDESEYVKLLEESVDLGVIDSTYFLGEYYLRNDQEEKAIGYFKTAAEGKMPAAKFQLVSYDLRTKELKKKERASLLDQLRSLASGDKDLLGEYAIYELTGFFGTEEPNEKEALRYAKEAAALGGRVGLYLVNVLSHRDQFEFFEFDFTKGQVAFSEKEKPLESDDQEKQKDPFTDHEKQETKKEEKKVIIQDDKIEPKVEKSEGKAEKIVVLDDPKKECPDDSVEQLPSSDSEIDWKKITKEWVEKKKAKVVEEEVSEEQTAKPLNKKTLLIIENLREANRQGKKKIRTSEVLNLLSQIAQEVPGSSMRYTHGSEYRAVIGNSTLKIDLNHGSTGQKMTIGRAKIVEKFVEKVIPMKGVFDDVEKVDQ